MESLKVQKRRVPIDALLLDGTQWRCEVFLGDSSADHAGTERLSDLLGKPDVFVPARDRETREVAWLNTSNLLVVKASAEADPEPDIPTLPTEHAIEVILAGGTSLKGLISYVRPDDSSRVTDFLNVPGSPFIRLIDGTSVVFIHKRHIARVLAGGW